MIEIVLNGEIKSVPPETTIEMLIQSLGLDPKWVVAEYNGRALVKTDYPRVFLGTRDRVELVRAVSGG